MPVLCDPPLRRRRRAFAVLAALCALTASTVAAQEPPATAALPPHGAPVSFAPLVDAQIDTVVNVSTTQERTADGPRPDLPQFPPGSPFEEFFRDFRGPRQAPPTRPESALGSGFIVDPSGYVVTNNHVVDGADAISVILHDGRKLSARLIGTDEATDLALLKVESAEPLPATRWGDSDVLAVGDWLVAIGNPFGLGGSVTAGILSARARDIQQGPYDDYLQTDAAINRGNSGGPLFNTGGEVVGINTAIYSPTGGSVGIGFAIPARIARPVIEQLRDQGRVSRGWLGVEVQPVTEDIAESLGLPDTHGALVTRVGPGGPAEAAGLRQGDVITGFNGASIGQMRDLPRVVAAARAGDRAEVTVWRDGRATSATVTVGELRPQAEAARTGSSEPAPDGTAAAPDALGLVLAPLDGTLRETFRIAPDIEGVVVTEVADGSPASERGIGPGDVIVSAGQEPVRTPEELLDKVEAARRSGRGSVLMLLNRGGDLRYVPLPLGDGRG